MASEGCLPATRNECNSQSSGKERFNTSAFTKRSTSKPGESSDICESAKEKEMQSRRRNLVGTARDTPVEPHVKPQWNPSGTPVEPQRNPSGTAVEFQWNRGAALCLAKSPWRKQRSMRQPSPLPSSLGKEVGSKSCACNDSI